MGVMYQHFNLLQVHFFKVPDLRTEQTQSPGLKSLPVLRSAWRDWISA